MEQSQVDPASHPHHEVTFEAAPIAEASPATSEKSNGKDGKDDKDEAASSSSSSSWGQSQFSKDWGSITSAGPVSDIIIRDLSFRVKLPPAYKVGKKTTPGTPPPEDIEKGLSPEVPKEGEEEQALVNNEGELRSSSSSLPTDIVVEGDKRYKYILRNISARVRTGRLTAILGQSGSGKTTMLEVLAQTCRIRGGIQGEIFLQDSPETSLKSLSGFVNQEDLLLFTMTVREVVDMAARLRLPKGHTEKERQHVVDEILTLLNLKHVENNYIGKEFKKAVSGGERRRTSIAVQFVSNPRILFLDEPTTGLDTYTAYAVVRQLKKIARDTNRIVLMSIHQPSSDIFAMVDDVIVLSEGRVVFAGDRENMIPYMIDMGFECPRYCNPADFLFLNILGDPVVARRFADKWTGMGQKEKNRLSGFLEDKSEIASESTQLIAKPTRPKPIAPFVTQFQCLFRRNFNRMTREPWNVMAEVIDAIFVSLFYALVYINSGSKPPIDQIRNTTGILYLLAISEFSSSMQIILIIYFEDKAVYLYEYGQGFYDVPAYYWSRFTIEVAIRFLLPYIRFLIIYYIVGLTPAFSSLLFMATIVAVTGITGTAFGFFLAALTNDPAVAVVAMPVIVLPLFLYSGVFTVPGSITPWLAWIRFISPIYYCFAALVQIQFANGLNNCDPEVFPCDGDLLLEALGLNLNLSPGVCLAIISAFFVAFALLGYVSLFSATKRASKKVN